MRKALFAIAGGFVFTADPRTVLPRGTQAPAQIYAGAYDTQPYLPVPQTLATPRLRGAEVVFSEPQVQGTQWWFVALAGLLGGTVATLAVEAKNKAQAVKKDVKPTIFSPKATVKSVKPAAKPVKRDERPTILSDDWAGDPNHPLQGRWTRGRNRPWEEQPYWNDPRIHQFGNSGVSGFLHAILAPISSTIIDNAGPGIAVRDKMAKILVDLVDKRDPSAPPLQVVDLCCGAGVSTRALQNAMPTANVMGMDTSCEMLRSAELWQTGEVIFGTQNVPEFRKANAEETKLPDSSVDLVVCVYGFHEIPFGPRERILTEMMRIVKPGGLVAVADISKDRELSLGMLAGEPYALEYQRNFPRQIGTHPNFSMRYDIAKGHLTMWTLRKPLSDPIAALKSTFAPSISIKQNGSSTLKDESKNIDAGSKPKFVSKNVDVTMRSASARKFDSVSV